MNRCRARNQERKHNKGLEELWAAAVITAGQEVTGEKWVFGYVRRKWFTCRNCRSSRRRAHRRWRGSAEYLLINFSNLVWRSNTRRRGLGSRERDLQDGNTGCLWRGFSGYRWRNWNVGWMGRFRYQTRLRSSGQL